MTANQGEGLKLPHNLDAEQALLGALLLENDIYERVPDHVHARHFFDPVHGRIFARIVEMIGKGARADPITLRSHFEDDEGLKEVGGVDYLVSLCDAPYPSIAAPGYARLIYDLAIKRAVVKVCEEAYEDATDGDLDVTGHELIERVEKALYGLVESGQETKGWESFSSALEEAVTQTAAAYEKGDDVTGLPTGFIDLDKKLGGLHATDLTIIAGRPSMGKTSLATNIGFNAAKRGAKVGFFSLEMSADQLAQRILSEYSGIPSEQMRRGDIQPDEFTKLRESAIELQALPLFTDATGGISLAALSNRARRLKRQHGLDLILVDYIQLMSGSGKNRGENRTQEIGEITSGLKKLAKELKVPVVALSQLSRAVEQRNDKRPQLSDLRDSGSIEQDADVVMFVYREAYYLGRTEPRINTPEHEEWMMEYGKVQGLAEVIIGKQRHGPIGKVDLSFTEATTSFGNRDIGGSLGRKYGGDAA